MAAAELPKRCHLIYLRFNLTLLTREISVALRRTQLPDRRHSCPSPRRMCRRRANESTTSVLNLWRLDAVPERAPLDSGLTPLKVSRGAKGIVPGRAEVSSQPRSDELRRAGPLSSSVTSASAHRYLRRMYPSGHPRQISFVKPAGFVDPYLAGFQGFNCIRSPGQTMTSATNASTDLAGEKSGAQVIAH